VIDALVSMLDDGESDADEARRTEEDIALADQGWRTCDAQGDRWRDPETAQEFDRIDALRRLAKDLAHRRSL
jgi:hypothetical protein